MPSVEGAENEDKRDAQHIPLIVYVQIGKRGCKRREKLVQHTGATRMYKCQKSIEGREKLVSHMSATKMRENRHIYTGDAGKLW